MGLRQALAPLAARAPVPVFVAVGVGGRGTAQDLRLHDRLELVTSPRAANILLVVGAPPTREVQALRRVHDAVSHPRASASWGGGDAAAAVRSALPDAVHVGGSDDPVAEVVAAHRRLLAGERRSEPALLPDEDPAEWRGVGPYGQGGSGMTGGVPHGRPMAERADDRDGLTLDQLRWRVGPFLPPLPPGLVLDVAVQGDVLQEVHVVDPEAGAVDDAVSPAHDDLAPFLRALVEPVRIADLELARARSHLRWLADALVALELPSVGGRALRLARALTPEHAGEVRRLARSVRRSRALGWATRRVGALRPEAVAGLRVGPVARACGLHEDLRAEDPAYRDLGFRPVTDEGGDAAARWRVRLAEAAASLDLASRAGDRTATVTGRVEGPRGVLEEGSAPAQRVRDVVEVLLVGQEWGDAITSLVSFDLDLDEALYARSLSGASR